ncbi:MAG: ABC-type iron(III) uptake system substrate-binding component FbpA [Oceanicaulis sp. HLUCCA04]|nr:MAG: ABC-type iron(III) uptake system substrate-binding component FbpA [Oceanicaulis sp. HLUCCA04]
MSERLRLPVIGAVCAALGLTACSQPEQDSVVNVFSARHYASDQAVFAAFTEETGIEINLVEADGDLLIERVRADGERSPADVIITVDAGRLHRAEQAGLFQPAGNLDGALDRVPDSLEHPDNLWFGFATRARVIVYARDRVDPSEVQNYADLAGPEFEGRVCVRSSSNVYNQSLVAGMIAEHGTEVAEEFARGIAQNLARTPQGGDTDQIRAVAAGECDVAIVNHYYLGRLLNAEDSADRAVGEAVGIVFPDQGEGGTYVNISGAGLAANAPNPEAARELLAFLLSERAQRAFAELTNEFPADPSISYDNTVLEGFAGFEARELNVNALGENGAEAQRIFDRAGWP